MLAGCDNIFDSKNSMNSLISEAKSKSISYKIGAINGECSQKIAKHLNDFLPESDDINAPILNVEYTFKEGPALIMGDKLTNKLAYDKLANDKVTDNKLTNNKLTYGRYIICKCKVEYLGQTKYFTCQYNSNSIKWQYDDMLFYKIAQNIFLVMVYLSKVKKDAAQPVEQSQQTTAQTNVQPVKQSQMAAQINTQSRAIIQPIIAQAK